MKTAPRHAGVVIVEDRNRPGDALPAEGALALALAAGAPRQRLLDFPFAVNDGSSASAEEVLELLDELKPAYRSTPVQRGDRTLHVIAPRD